MLRLLIQLIHLYEIILFAAALSTWIAPGRDHPVFRLLRSLTTPVLKPLRPLIPQMGGMDITPAVAILLLEVLARLLGRVG